MGTDRSLSERPVLDRPVDEPDLVWHVPEPSTLWIDAAPRSRSRRRHLRLDPRTRDLAGIGRRPPLARARPPHGPSTVYLAEEGGASDRKTESAEVVAWCDTTATALLRHVEPGEEHPATGVALVDGLSAVVEGRWDALSEAPRHAVVLWPLLAGIGDSAEALSVGLDAATASGPRAVVGLLPELSRRARRVLSEQYGETVFDALFHPRPARPRAFAAACAERGLDFLPPRLIEVGPRRLERAVAAELALVADLLVGLGASPAEAQRFYRAARWVEATPHDLADLLGHDNLAIVPSIDDEIEGLIGELAAGRRRSSRLETLVERWIDWERGVPESP